MKIGLLWQNGEPGAYLEDMVKAAAIQFRDKFGLGFPDTAHVHPSALGKVAAVTIDVIDDRPGQEDDGHLVPGAVVRVLASPYMQPGQVWIGQKEQG